MHRMLDDDLTSGSAGPQVIALAPQSKTELARGSLDSLLAKREMPHFPEACSSWLPSQQHWWFRNTYPWKGTTPLPYSIQTRLIRFHSSEISARLAKTRTTVICDWNLDSVWPLDSQFHSLLAGYTWDSRLNYLSLNFLFCCCSSDTNSY